LADSAVGFEDLRIGASVDDLVSVPSADEVLGATVAYPNPHLVGVEGMGDEFPWAEGAALRLGGQFVATQLVALAGQEVASGGPSHASLHVVHVHCVRRAVIQSRVLQTGMTQVKLEAVVLCGWMQVGGGGFLRSLLLAESLGVAIVVVFLARIDFRRVEEEVGLFIRSAGNGIVDEGAAGVGVEVGADAQARLLVESVLVRATLIPRRRHLATLTRGVLLATQVDRDQCRVVSVGSVEAKVFVVNFVFGASVQEGLFVCFLFVDSAPFNDVVKSIFVQLIIQIILYVLILNVLFINDLVIIILVIQPGRWRTNIVQCVFIKRIQVVIAVCLFPGVKRIWFISFLSDIVSLLSRRRGGSRWLGIGGFGRFRCLIAFKVGRE